MLDVYISYFLLFFQTFIFQFTAIYKLSNYFEEKYEYVIQYTGQGGFIVNKEYIYLSDLEVATNNYENMKNCLYGWVEQDYLKYREEMNKIVNKYNEIKQLISQANTKEDLDNIKIIF